MLKGGKGGKGGSGGGVTDDNGNARYNIENTEYKVVGLLIAEFIWTFRLSMGDFAVINATKNLSSIEIQIFWVIWFMTTLMTSIIFLNFVVAEAMCSYEKVKEYLESIIQRERAVLIVESEEMTIRRYKTQEKYPKFLIVRETEY